MNGAIPCSSTNPPLKQMTMKAEMLNDEFLHRYRDNPIEHIKSRLKTAESIVRKLKMMDMK